MEDVDFQKRMDTETRVKNFLDGLKGKYGTLKQLFKGQVVLFLSCEKELREKAKDILNAEGYTGFVTEDFKTMFPLLPEFEVEKEAMSFVDIIIAVEPPTNKEGWRCPGFVQECTYIMQNKKLQDKTIYVVSEDVSHSQITKLDGLHYIYFPNIYKYPNKVGENKSEEVVNCCVALAKKEIHRNCIMLLNNSGESEIERIINEKNKIITGIENGKK